jgi:hypothetical protein
MAHRGLWGCQMSRIPHFLGNRLTYGGEVVSLMHWLCSTPQKDLLVLICVRGRINPRVRVWLERLCKLITFNSLIGTQNLVTLQHVAYSLNVLGYRAPPPEHRLSTDIFDK